MIKVNIIKKICVAALTASLVTQGSVVNAAYYGGDAVKYAEMWYGGYNTDKYYKASLDCTNFVSQCLVAGGKKPSSTLPDYYNTNYWRPHSATWENATYWRKYWKDRTSRCGRELPKYSIQKINNDFYSHVSLGDVVQWGYSTSDIKHSQLVQRFVRRADGNYTCYMIQHTDRKSVV